MRIPLYILLSVLLLGNGPLRAQTGFLENLGQLYDQVDYRLQLPGQDIFVDGKGFTVLLHDQEKWHQLVDAFHHRDDRKLKHIEPLTLGFHAIAYRFLGAHFGTPEQIGRSAAYFNYFIGNDPDKWVSGARKYDKLIYRGIYPHIDLELIGTGGGFKYNFILHPGADLEDIRFRILGANGLEIRSDEIEVSHRFGTFTERMPLVYTEDAQGEQQVLQLAYADLQGAIGFAGTVPLEAKTVIDPELVFSTYSGNTADNFGFTATYDADGNFYSGGIAEDPTTVTNGFFITTPGAFDGTFNGGVDKEPPINLPCDIAISKYDPTGSTLIYGTYLGGRFNEFPHSLIVDDQNRLVVFGTSKSTDFPTKNAPQASNSGGTDLIITKFNASGGGLIGSTYLGGSQNDGLNASSATKYFYADDFRGEVNLDAAGNIYVASSTNSDDFPTTTGAAKEFYNGGQDGILASFSPDLSTLRWCSYYGGAKDDAIYSIDPDNKGNLYISGGTNSFSLPATSGAVQPAFEGGRSDGFMACIKEDGSEVIRSSYWGTDGYEQIFALEIDRHGDIFVVGHGTDTIPLLGEVYSSTGKQFISKFSPDLKTVLLSSRYGSGKLTPDITINAFLVDECDKIFISGWGGSIHVGPQQKLSGMPLTSDALQRTTDGNDFHFAVFRRDMSDLVYATYFGGDETDDHVDGGTSRFDRKGIMYQSVCSSCPNGDEAGHNDFPTTSGAFAEKNVSSRCSNASVKLAFGNLNRAPEPSPVRYEVIANDILDFYYPILDRDADTIHIRTIRHPEKHDRFLLFPDSARFDPTNFTRTYDSLHFQFQARCEDVGDTIHLPILTWDIGCPSSKDSNSFVEIVVLPPPLLDPPEIICLQFSGKDGVLLDWNNVPPSPYFKELRLYKRHPNGNVELLATYNSPLAGSHLDNKAFSPRINDYTYYFEVVNICDSVGPRSYELSTVRESEVPIEATYLRTVTVEGKQLRIEWLRSTENDFDHYELYKSKRGGTETVYLTSIGDINQTYFYDKDVDVDHTSYCYQVRVSDNCGHLSAKSNYGCSIVIRGSSPKYYFELDWDDYLEWAGGVESYELIRATDSLDFRPIVWNSALDLDHTDRDLDLDWGGYYFSVIAHEGAGSQDASSRSNDIYLIQPPFVFVPNAVTSNGDGINDHFGWSDAFVLDFRMQVYNRWGELVFESTDKNANWNGIFKENSLRESSVYVWIVKYSGWDGSQHVDKGTVTFLR